MGQRPAHCAHLLPLRRLVAHKLGRTVVCQHLILVPHLLRACARLRRKHGLLLLLLLFRRRRQQALLLPRERAVWQAVAGAHLLLLPVLWAEGQCLLLPGRMWLPGCQPLAQDHRGRRRVPVGCMSKTQI